MCHPKVGEAILLVREADHEFVNSNLEQAKQKYQNAGDCLVSFADSEKLTPYDRTVTYFSAAVAYYKGGMYKDVLNVFGKVNPSIMGKDLLEQYKNMSQHAKEKLSASNMATYVDSVQKSIDRAKKQKGNGKNCTSHCESVLDILADNPYLLSPSLTAKYRQIALQLMDRHEDAALFDEDVKMK